MSEINFTGIIGGTIAIGRYVVNDYVITITETEGDYGYTMTITKGDEVQTVTLYGLTSEQYTSMLGYLQQALTAATNAQTAAQEALTAAQSASTSASSASTDATTASQAASQAASSASSASQSASAASGSATSAATSASSASASATSAQTAQTAAETAQTAAESAASNASTAATNAATSASQAAQSATDAAGSVSAAAQTLTQVQSEGAAQIAAIGAEGERVMESIPADYTALEGEVTELKSAFNSALNPEEFAGDAITPTTNNGWYISTNVQLISQKNQDFKVSTVPVSKGVKYRLQGTTRLQAAYPLVAFGTTNVMTVGETGTLVILGSTTNTAYDEYYTPSEDGYLWIASFSTRPILTVTQYYINYKNLPTRQTLKVQLFGDSITDNTWGDLGTWVNYIQEYMPIYDLTIVNSATGGSRLSKSSNTTNAVENLIEDGTTVVSDANLIVIWAGTNDWANGGPELGTFLGTYGIYGAVKNIITTLSTNVPSAMILFATPLQRYNDTDAARETDANGTPINGRGYTLRQFCNAIMETCEYYGVPCIDMNAMSGINRINARTFLGDGLHPNMTGDKRIAHIMCKKINSLFGVS